jgi:hypothetical protein
MTKHHCVTGFFGDLAHAQATQTLLTEMGLPLARLQIFKKDSDIGAPPEDRTPQAGSDTALKDMLVDGAIGRAVGVGLGALAEVAIVAANVSLFIASPLLAPLVMLGWGAAVGGTVGAMVGAEKNEAPLSALIRDAVSNGQVVLVANTETDQETSMTRDAMRSAVGDFKEVTPG